MNLFIYLFYFILVFFHPIFILAQTNSNFIITAKNNFGFAKNLYDEGDYLRAANEFERCLFYSKNLESGTSDSILFWIGKSFRNDGKYKESNIFFKKISPINTDFYLDTKLLISLNYFNLEKNDSSLVFLDYNQKRLPNYANQYKYKQLKLANYLILKQFDQANRCLSDISESYSPIFKELLLKSRNSKRKSPVLAGTLSALVPGSGKVYTNRFWDGLYSFLIIGVTSWRAYEGYKSKGFESVDFWVFGSMASYFYLGNIYGSAISAKIYNQKIDNEIKNSIEVFINVNF